MHDAQTNLGLYLYYKGQGVKRDKIKAYQYYDESSQTRRYYMAQNNLDFTLQSKVLGPVNNQTLLK